MISSLLTLMTVTAVVELGVAALELIVALAVVRIIKRF